MTFHIISELYNYISIYRILRQWSGKYGNFIAKNHLRSTKKYSLSLGSSSKKKTIKVPKKHERINSFALLT